jgi:hypothetical protein
LFESAPFLLGKEPQQVIADQWADSSRKMAALAKSSGALYLHILQPNRYFGSRTFSSEESEVALLESSPYRQAVEELYPRLQEHGNELQNEGVRWVDATTLFDEIVEPTYSDNCCHYNQRGNYLLAEFVAVLLDRMSEEARSSRGPPDNERGTAERTRGLRRDADANVLSKTTPWDEKSAASPDNEASTSPAH